MYVIPLWVKFSCSHFKTILDPPIAFVSTCSNPIWFEIFYAIRSVHTSRLISTHFIGWIDLSIFPGNIFVDLLYFAYVSVYFPVCFMYLFECRPIELIGNSLSSTFFNTLYEPTFVIVLHTFHLIGQFICYRMLA